MREYYLKNENGEKTFVGYKVNSSYELANAGYFISDSFRDVFIKYRRKGVVYIDPDFNFLYFRNQSIIPVKSKDDYALDWHDYVMGCIENGYF